MLRLAGLAALGSLAACATVPPPPLVNPPPGAAVFSPLRCGNHKLTPCRYSYVVQGNQVEEVLAFYAGQGWCQGSGTQVAGRIKELEIVSADGLTSGELTVVEGRPVQTTLHLRTHRKPRVCSLKLTEALGLPSQGQASSP